jgi:double-stranded uracil-DNA glycosylase
MAARRGLVTPVRSFAPIAAPNARVLILGSMPGRASLAASQYYAHPRNRFWHILGELLGFDPGRVYQERVQALQSAGIALWDVLASCVRPTSMDADIDADSLIVNDFETFYGQHRRVAQVFFNGATAAECYRRQMLPRVRSMAIEYHRLPSTSPAHAGISYHAKLEAWRAIARALAGEDIADANSRIWTDGSD